MEKTTLRIISISKINGILTYNGINADVDLPKLRLRDYYECIIVSVNGVRTIVSATLYAQRTVDVTVNSIDSNNATGGCYYVTVTIDEGLRFYSGNTLRLAAGIDIQEPGSYRISYVWTGEIHPVITVAIRMN